MSTTFSKPDTSVVKCICMLTHERRTTPSYELRKAVRKTERRHIVDAYLKTLGINSPTGASGDDILEQMRLDLTGMGFSFEQEPVNLDIEQLDTIIKTRNHYLLDKSRKELMTPDGIKVHLTPKQCSVLYELMTRLGRVVPHQRLLIRAWGRRYLGNITSTERSKVAVVIWSLRNKLGDTIVKDELGRDNGQLIKNCFDEGYCFTDKVL